MFDNVTEQLRIARGHESGRSAATVFHGERLSQTLLALTAGTALGEHENPGEATLLVLEGRIVLTAGEQTWQGGPGDLLPIPGRRHSVTALENSAVLLSVARQ